MADNQGGAGNAREGESHRSGQASTEDLQNEHGHENDMDADKSDAAAQNLDSTTLPQRGR